MTSHHFSEFLTPSRDVICEPKPLRLTIILVASKELKTLSGYGTALNFNFDDYFQAHFLIIYLINPIDIDCTCTGST